MLKSLKRIAFLFLLIGILAACSTTDEGAETSEEPVDKEEASSKIESKDGEEAEDEDLGTIDVDKGLLTVDITLPAEFFMGEEIDEILSDARAKGVKDVKENEDGSITFTMSKKDHKQMMKDMAEEVEEAVEEIIADEEFDSIKDISYNRSYSEFTLSVDRDSFEEGFDSFAVLGVGLQGMFYQLFNGKNMDKSKVKIKLEDTATKKIFDEIIYPDSLDDWDADSLLE